MQRAPLGHTEWAKACARLDATCYPPRGLWTAAQHSQELCSDRTDMLSAWHGSELVAFSYASNILDETHVLSMGVRPDFRGRSLAKMMLLSSVSRAFRMGQTLCTLEVRAGNEAAIALYRACGFHDVGVRKRYYSQPQEDAIIMTCLQQEHEKEIVHCVESCSHAALILAVSESITPEQTFEVIV